MSHIRAHIRLDKAKDVKNFVSSINSDGTTDKYILENFDSSHIVDARSYLGALYFAVEHADDTFLVNLSNDGKIPFFIDKYRI